jgi:diguanylate cyclase (GGDEF)-like protein
MDDKQQVSRKLIRIGMTTYVCGLLLIGAFSVGGQFITNSIVRGQEENARVINLSERQRMLSQRIARLALERALHSPFEHEADPEADPEAELIRGIDQIEQNHRTLLRRALAPTRDLSSSLVREVYLGPQWNLDARMQDFLLHARAVAAHPASTLSLSNPDLRAVEVAAQSPLLNALDAAVQANERTSDFASEHLQHVLTILTRSMLLVLFLEALFLYRPLFRRLASAQYELLEAGRTDPLTGCLNRRAFGEEAKRILLETREQGGQISVLMIDIDRFKPINDRFGHATGDKVINAVVATLLKHIEKHHILCRMGGEEFAVMLPGDTLDQAAETAETLRAAIAAKPIHLDAPVKINGESHASIPVTVSIGASDLKYSDSSLFRVLGRADKAVYRAKNNGRNRVELEPSEYSNDADFIYPKRPKTRTRDTVGIPASQSPTQVTEELPRLQ